MVYQMVSFSLITCWILFLVDNSSVNAYLGIQLNGLHVVLVFAGFIQLVGCSFSTSASFCYRFVGLQSHDGQEVFSKRSTCARLMAL